MLFPQVLYHTGPEVHPDERDVPASAGDDLPGGGDRGGGPARGRAAQLDAIVAEVGSYVRRHFPLLDGDRPAIRETCLYTMSPDERPILDRLPGRGGAVVGCGFSGSGFKHAPNTGQMLAALAMGEEAALPEDYLLPRYQLARFDEHRPKL